MHTTARAYANAEYTDRIKLFDEQTTSTIASSSMLRAQERVVAVQHAVSGIVDATSTEEVLAVRGDLDVVRRGEDIIVRYSGSMAKLPYYFCTENASGTPCVSEIVMDRQGHIVRDIAFYPSNAFDALILTRDDAVVVTEIDPRGGWQNTQHLLQGQSLATRVTGTQIYISDKKAIYEVIMK